MSKTIEEVDQKIAAAKAEVARLEKKRDTLLEEEEKSIVKDDELFYDIAAKFRLGFKPKYVNHFALFDVRRSGNLKNRGLVLGFEPDCRWEIVRDDLGFWVLIPKSKKKAIWHNPDNINPQVLPPGYRFLIKDVEKENDATEWYNSYSWIKSDLTGPDPLQNVTYRTNKPLPEGWEE